MAASSSCLLDTGFFISLVDKNRPHHSTATEYYRYFLDNGVGMLMSTIVAAEFALVQPITDLPLRNFRVLPFNVDDAIKCAELNAHRYRSIINAGQRDAVKDDFKIIAQAAMQQVLCIVTEDDDSLYRYCARLQADGLIKFGAVRLSEGFDEALVSKHRQGRLDL